jgi:DNA-directed RNA polymerase subunit RPC12/RpoP
VDNDWTYNCIGCGRQVTADAGFKGNCPVCGGARWLCHWVKPGFVTDKASASIEGTFKAEIPLGQAVDLVKTPPGNLAQPFGKPGPKTAPKLRDSVCQLASQGLSSRKIAEELTQQGMRASYRTVARLLARQKQGVLIK